MSTHKNMGIEKRYINGEWVTVTVIDEQWYKDNPPINDPYLENENYFKNYRKLRKQMGSTYGQDPGSGFLRNPGRGVE